MQTTTVTRALAATGIAAAAVLTPFTAGVAAAASPAGTSPGPGSVTTAVAGIAAPSACRPANYRGTVAPDAASAGHHHYRVTLVAAPGTSACTLAGSPTGVGFDKAGSPVAVSATAYGDQSRPVAFGPGAPVHFDIRVPNSAGGAKAGTVTFTLQAPDGEIPGEGAAGGYMEVDAGTAVGPVQPGA